MHPSKLLVVKRDTANWSTSYRRSRREEIILCRLRIGHCEFSHGYLLRGLEAPTCECGAPRTVRHILVDCPKFSMTRSALSMSETMAEILSDEENKVKTTLEYLKKIKFYNRV